MARKSYSDEFRRRAVDLYESTPGATLKGIAVDLGVSRGSLKEWVGRPGSGTTAGPAAPSPSALRPLSQAARITRLEAELSASQAEARKLAEERDILRQAAKVDADTALAAKVRALQDPALGGDRAYGSPRITADVNEGLSEAEWVNRKRVMREHKLAGIRLRRRVKATIPDQSGRRFPDLLGREFTAVGTNLRYVGDITYLPIGDGSNLYLATVIDLCSRKLAGAAIADHMRTQLVDPLIVVSRVRVPPSLLKEKDDPRLSGRLFCSTAAADRGAALAWGPGCAVRRATELARPSGGGSSGSRVPPLLQKCWSEASYGVSDQRDLVPFLVDLTSP